MTGAPNFYYGGITDVDEMYQLIKAGDASDYLMSGETAGYGVDSVYNGCGIAMSHAYSLITAFEVTHQGEQHDLIMFRNPWSISYYEGPWAAWDDRWTDATVAQVPYGIDPRTAQDTEGIFIVPKEQIHADAGCIEAVDILHVRDADGYTDDWYDEVGATEEQYTYRF